MDAEFLAVTPAGDIVPKQRLVPDDPEKAVPKLPPFDLDRPIVHLYGGAAVVTGTWVGKGTSDGKPVNAQERWTDTWVTIGRWQCVASHSSPMK